MFKLEYTDIAKSQIYGLESKPYLNKRFKSVLKAINLLRQNPRHPSLNTHEYTKYSKEFGFKVYEAYAENNTPQAYRIFFSYGKEKNTIVILRVTPHP